MLRHIAKRRRMDDDFNGDLDNDPNSAGPGAEVPNSDDVSTAEVEPGGEQVPGATPPSETPEVIAPASSTVLDDDTEVDREDDERDEAEYEADDEADIAEADSDIADADAATESMMALESMMASAKAVGYASAGMVTFARSKGLLEGTSLQTGSLESFNVDNSAMALEAFGDAARAKMKTFAATAKEKTRSAFNALANRLGAAQNSLKEIQARLKGKISETAKVVPFKQIAVIVGSIAAAATVLAVVVRAVNSGKADTGAVTGALKAIAYPSTPFAKPQKTDIGEKLVMEWGPAAQRKLPVVIASEGEWTSQKAVTLFSSAAKSIVTIKGLLKDLATAFFRIGRNKASTEARIPEDMAGMAVHYFHLFCRRVVTQVFQKTILKGLSKIMAVLRSLFKSKPAAAA